MKVLKTSRSLFKDPAGGIFQIAATSSRLVPLLALLLLGACSTRASRAPNISVFEATPLLTNPLLGNTTPVRDPSIALQNGTYYLFSTDPANPPPNQFLPIRCSTDKLTWTACGQVFTVFPAWIKSALPGVGNLWAPDISFFNGLYHLYYAASTLDTQSSVIGVATNTTLDPTDPAYKWVDHGQVIASQTGDDFNAIDPNILVDSNQNVWLTYGSFWTGIKQRQIDPATGMLLASNPSVYQLAYRPNIPDHAEEGSSLVQYGSYYYLFLSVDHCCESSTSLDDYKEIVGRSSSPNGPFVDAVGIDLMDGGGSILLEGNGDWVAPGGGTVYLNPQSGESLIVFHALNASQNGTPSLWVKTVTFQNGWPLLD